MSQKELGNIVDRLVAGAAMDRNGWLRLLSLQGEEERQYVQQRAMEVAQQNFGNGVFVRGLIEISSYCRNNCNYCGIRCGNRSALRYRLTKEQILECCRAGAGLGFNTFVLQGGEDVVQSDDWVTDVVCAIKREFPDKAVTLSVGERSAAAYRAFRAAGADRYLLRHETRSDEHYSLLHPRTMSAVNRRNCLFTLKELGFQTGSGMMIGSPHQTLEHLADDMMFLDELCPQMIGVGPFIPASGTPFEDFSAGSVDLTILVVSLLRLRFPHALLPATTALASLHSRGRELAILAGANVVMPNLSPSDVRNKYSIYNNKKSTGDESAQQIESLRQSLDAIGYRINFSRGDYDDK
ncbi:MAG: [Bacteroidaceae bacterium]|nr:[FeFe] hydrogenase H-cluster radical SAM maturase HydE [Bacteroidaceae bacterium]